MVSMRFLDPGNLVCHSPKRRYYLTVYIFSKSRTHRGVQPVDCGGYQEVTGRHSLDVGG